MSSAQASGVAVAVIAFVGCIVAQLVGVICYKQGLCEKGTPRPFQARNNGQTLITAYPLTSFPTQSAGSNTMSHTVYATAYATTTPQISLNGTQQLHHGQQPQHQYQPQPDTVCPDAATSTLDEPPHFETATDAGEAPANHAAVHYEMMTLDAFKSLKLSEDSASKSDL